MKVQFFCYWSVLMVWRLTTDVGRGTSGTSRDVPIFVQFHKKIRTVHDTKREKKVAKKKADLEKKIDEDKKRERDRQ